MPNKRELRRGTRPHTLIAILLTGGALSALAGAAQATVAEASPATAETEVGGSGSPPV